ncbi:hypothetical protein EYF80_043746 [Liparis tanakae]|uniref:Uncharacterized protein n=1 Tax=Liparis tanakae TaxID=230148 RepID=A0A4Z2FXR6_9TELE|nr:hypothetical protein EYF80_043746 [Liparis tanakae]
MDRNAPSDGKRSELERRKTATPTDAPRESSADHRASTPLEAAEPRVLRGGSYEVLEGHAVPFTAHLAPSKSLNLRGGPRIEELLS